MANRICAVCRFYHPYGNGTGYCSARIKDVRHYGSCVDFEEN